MENHKQAGIFNRIKALVAKTSKSIIWRGRPKDNEISEKIARKIQKNSYDFSQLKRKDSYTPPYLILSEQLQVEDEQIFRAAVYNMANIAKARRKYRSDILNIFNDYIINTAVSEAKKDYLKRKVAEINAIK